MNKIYRNRLVINQRGGNIVVNNTTDQESVHISQHSGSNLLLNNLVNSELATNNKQTLVINDEFNTVGNDSTNFVKRDRTTRVCRNSYELKGFLSKSEIEAFQKWKDIVYPVAKINARFKIKRGGVSYPNGENLPQSGTRTSNPVIGSKTYTVENSFTGYNKLPVRTFALDEVTTYVPVTDRAGSVATNRNISTSNIQKSGGTSGSSAPGVIEYGGTISPATEGGTWENDTDAQNIDQKFLELQDTLTPIEQQMGDGGDENIFVKRNKVETIGAVFNDFPSIRIDLKGRSQPLEMLVSDVGVFKNHDYIPHVEEVDNSSNFPCGQDNKIVGNIYTRVVGSGGISLKTTGAMELGGATLKTGFKKININASHGVHIGSENGVEIQSLKTIVLRTNRQVFVESSLGVKNNLIVGGGLAVEGETYLQHVTAPLEMQQTENTVVAGKFATSSDRKLFIAECQIGDAWYPVYAIKNDDLIFTYPHSHHFANLPLTLTKSNSDVRKFAQNNNINKHNTVAQAFPQLHEKKKEKSL